MPLLALVDRTAVAREVDPLECCSPYRAVTPPTTIEDLRLEPPACTNVRPDLFFAIDRGAQVSGSGARCHRTGCSSCSLAHVARDTETVELTDEELLQRIEEVTRGVEDGTIGLWHGDEPIVDHLERTRRRRQ
jgi:hypothetical protein